MKIYSIETSINSLYNRNKMYVHINNCIVTYSITVANNKISVDMQQVRGSTLSMTGKEKIHEFITKHFINDVLAEYVDIATSNNSDASLQSVMRLFDMRAKEFNKNA